LNKNSGKLAIKDWAEQDRPREKLERLGTRALTNAELLAIILGSGNREQSAFNLAQQILRGYNNQLQDIPKLGITALCAYKGIGKAKAVSILAALALGVRSTQDTNVKMPKIKSSAQAYRCMEPELRTLSHEEFWVLYLNNANVVLQKSRISVGGYTGTVVDVRIILKQALQIQAVALVLVHNHPSGTIEPSKADIQITNKIKTAAQSMDIAILDHIIFTEKAYFSFADQQML